MRFTRLTEKNYRRETYHMLQNEGEGVHERESNDKSALNYDLSICDQKCK